MFELLVVPYDRIIGSFFEHEPTPSNAAGKKVDREEYLTDGVEKSKEIGISHIWAVYVFAKSESSF